MLHFIIDIHIGTYHSGSRLACMATEILMYYILWKSVLAGTLAV